jgi:hypothetical protein
METHSSFRVGCSGAETPDFRALMREFRVRLATPEWSIPYETQTCPIWDLTPRDAADWEAATREGLSIIQLACLPAGEVGDTAGLTTSSRRVQPELSGPSLIGP